MIFLPEPSSHRNVSASNHSVSDYWEDILLCLPIHSEQVFVINSGTSGQDAIRVEESQK